jgi:T-complex protein 1 subunit delta
MDKMIQKSNGEVLITNDGATILSQMEVFHPTAKMLVEISKSQDIEAGDGTTSVCVIAGSLLNACYQLLQKGIHPTTISESFQLACKEAMNVLTKMSRPLLLTDRDALIAAVNTCLSSKVVSQNSDTISPIAVDAVLTVIDVDTATVRTQSCSCRHLTSPTRPT